MRYLLICGLLAVVVQQSVAPPVTKNVKKESDDKSSENEIDDKEDMAEVIEYHRYLKEVVEALESDPEFRAKLEKGDSVDIRTGKIAHELEYVSHQVRSQLDELKRLELERLRHLAVKEYELENGLDPDHLKIAEHIDHSNPHTFEIDDLKKLIAKTTHDLSEADKRRREEFKEYEMQKKFEQEQKMKGNTGMDEEHRKKYEAELHNMEDKHKKHEKLHHPGSKQQLEEVWEKQDHMASQDFDPRTFFYLHDLDGNGVWDQDEVKALFLKELDKLYAEGAPEDDLRERAEEMERMREHVFSEADLNQDGLISYHEFLEQTKKPDFQQDSGWQGLDEQQVYSQQEYEAFERERQKEIQRIIAQGMLPPHPDSHDPGHQQQFPPQYAPVPHSGSAQEFVPAMGARVPELVPHGQQQQHPQQGHPVPQQHYQGQPAHFQDQAAHQQQFQQLPPQQHHYPSQVPQQQQQHQGNVPPQQHQFQGQPSHQQQQINQQQQQQQQQFQQQQQQLHQQQQQQLHQQQQQQQPPAQAQPAVNNQQHHAQEQQQQHAPQVKDTQHQPIQQHAQPPQVQQQAPIHSQQQVNDAQNLQNAQKHVPNVVKV